MITLWISQAGAGRRRARPVRRGRRRDVRSALLFLLPTDWENREFTLRWSDAAEIDWGTIILFGTGIILGSLISLGASFGLSVLVWHLLGVDLYWVILPLAVILLLAAGSDYNLLLVSPVQGGNPCRHQHRHHPVHGRHSAGAPAAGSAEVRFRRPAAAFVVLIGRAGEAEGGRRAPSSTPRSAIRSASGVTARSRDTCRSSDHTRMTARHEVGGREYD